MAPFLATMSAIATARPAVRIPSLVAKSEVFSPESGVSEMCPADSGTLIEPHGVVVQVLVDGGQEGAVVADLPRALERRRCVPV